MDVAALRQHLQGRREQLRALILLLENRGENHPQYSQIEILKAEYQTVLTQLKKLNK